MVGPDTRLLILGSLPGSASLASGHYHAHPANQFWRLLGEVLEADLVCLAYPARLTALKAARIGLSDVLAGACRKGSADSGISRPLARAFAEPLPALRCVAFNGQAAARLGAAQWADCAARLLTLPSSSARATIAYPLKLRKWMALRSALDAAPAELSVSSRLLFSSIEGTGT